MNTLWLGYDGLELPYDQIAAVLLYHPALDTSIARAYGKVPPGVLAVVVTAEGAYFPARWGAAQLRGRLARWRGRQDLQDDNASDRGLDGDDGDA
jgi:hypothetical protein